MANPTIPWSGSRRCYCELRPRPGLLAYNLRQAMWRRALSADGLGSQSRSPYAPGIWLLPLLAALLLSACLAQPHPDKTVFGLNLEPAEVQTRAMAGRRTVLLATVTAASGYENRSLVYKVGPDQFKVDFYNEFLAPPARLLADQTAQYLDRESARFRLVKTPGLALADYGLETYLEHIHGDYSGPVPQADLAIRFTLNDLRGQAPRVVLDRTFQRSRPLAENSPSALAAALRECLAEILNELNQDMNKSVR